jgi:hypothetical protein
MYKEEARLEKRTSGEWDVGGKGCLRKRTSEERDACNKATTEINDFGELGCLGVGRWWVG